MAPVRDTVPDDLVGGSVERLATGFGFTEGPVWSGQR